MNGRKQKIRLACVGDILFTDGPGSIATGRGLDALSNECKTLLVGCDLVFANLECTLGGTGKVPTEPRLVATEKQMGSLSEAGVQVVSIGNNHAFDCLDEGFHKTRSYLERSGIYWCGAGENLKEAMRPAILDVGGYRLAFLAVVDSSSEPYRFAGESASGVAPLDASLICGLIDTLRDQVDHIIVSPHWGRERFRVPSPQQIEQAHLFIDAGASMVVGHHPHVIQGLEIYMGAPIAYSLGNFLANNVYWSDGDFLNWDRPGRTGYILLVDLESDGVCDFQQVATYDDGITVHLDKSGYGGRRIRKANHFLGRGITPSAYNWEVFHVRIIRSILVHMKWSEMRKIRPRHFKKALSSGCEVAKVLIKQTSQHLLRKFSF